MGYGGLYFIKSKVYKSLPYLISCIEIHIKLRPNEHPLSVFIKNCISLIRKCSIMAFSCVALVKCALGQSIGLKMTKFPRIVDCNAYKAQITRSNYTQYLIKRFIGKISRKRKK